LLALPAAGGNMKSHAGVQLDVELAVVAFDD
jgi:hypothetical protein